jgi:hypothetical protein
MVRFDDILEKASAYIGEKDIPILQKAYVFAARAHKGQVRRSGEPYLSHPLEVTARLADLHLDRTTLVAGLLHDALEDTDVTAAEIREAFGKETPTCGSSSSSSPTGFTTSKRSSTSRRTSSAGSPRKRSTSTHPSPTAWAWAASAPSSRTCPSAMSHRRNISASPPSSSPA